MVRLLFANLIGWKSICTYLDLYLATSPVLNIDPWSTWSPSPDLHTSWSMTNATCHIINMWKVSHLVSPHHHQHLTCYRHPYHPDDTSHRDGDRGSSGYRSRDGDGDSLPDSDHWATSTDNNWTDYDQEVNAHSDDNILDDKSWGWG